jgi:Ca2+-binding EF-hand superfamily protein|eukprot:COSAG01_NODE_7047_length_3377_cov_3.161684_2_plen_168_part_00
MDRPGNREQSNAELSSGHLKASLAKQMKDRFTASGMTMQLLFKSFDKDNEGSIDVVRPQTFVFVLHGTRCNEKGLSNWYYSCFVQTEFEKMLRSLGVNFTAKESREVFALVDQDGGGEIDLGEFETWFNDATQPRRTKRRGSLNMDDLGAIAEASELSLSVAQTKES